MYECPVTQPMSAVHQYTSDSGLRSNTAWCVYDACVRYPPDVCRIPFGLPVVPDVYRMNSGCSASNACASCSFEAVATVSSQRTSRSCQPTSWPVRLTTRTFSTDGHCSTASSTMGLSANGLPLRKPPSAQITSFAPASSMRLDRAAALKPPNTTEWGAPMRAHASIATAASGIIGM